MQKLEVKEGEKVYSEYSNELVLENKVKPQLFNATLTACGEECGEFIPILNEGKYYYDLRILNTEDYNLEAYNEELKFTIYEKNGETYKEVGAGTVGGAVQVAVEPGERKVFVTRVYTEDEETKYYSEYSNEIVIDHTIYGAPTLSNGMGAYVNGVLSGTITIVAEGEYAEGTDSITGVKFYERDGEELKLLEDNTTTFSTSIEVNPGEEKTYVARVYALNSKGEKVYSEYSNVVKIKKQYLRVDSLFFFLLY